MEQEFVTLPRSVLEQALEAFEAWDARGRLRVMNALRAALDQTQEPPYGECDECGTEYSFDPTDGGSICVACLKERLKQPQCEQEPVAWLTIEVMGPRTKVDVEWEDQLQKLPSGIYKLYTHPQPKREPLTDEQIDKIGSEHEKFTKGGSEWFDRWTFARAIERAHGIGNKT